MTNFATLTDVEDRFGRLLTESEVRRASSLIDLAAALVSLHIGGRTYADDEVPDIVRSVTVSVIERGLRNPEGFQQHTAGPFSYTRQQSWGGVWLTDDEKGALNLVIGRAGVVSVRTPATDAFLEAVSVFGESYVGDESDEGDDGS